MRENFIMVFLAGWLAISEVAQAQTLNQEMAGLADKLSKTLVAQGYKNVAAVDFTDLQGQPTELGRFLSERLVVEIVSTGGVSMVDRANIKSILAEHKLTEEGLVNPANAKKLGEFAGVDAILIGNATALDSGIELLVKVVATESSKLVAAGRITFPTTADIQQLLNRGISSSGNAVSATTSAPGSGPSYRGASAIVTRDIGSLRVILRSAMPMKLKDQQNQSVNGIRCSFEFVNRETQRPIAVAMNAEPYRPGRGRPGDALRTTLLDDRGSVWRLSTSGLNGASIVSVGLIPGNIYGNVPKSPDPTEIAEMLKRRDETGTNIQKGDGYQFEYVLGSMAQISPGQSVTVAMNFVQDANETTPETHPTFFQLNSEIVVGVVTTARTKSYALHNLTFDRVSLLVDGVR